MVERAGGHLDRAMESLRKSRQMFEDQGHRLELGQVMLEEALLYRNLGQIQEAQRLGKESAALCQSINASLISDRASNFLDSLQDMI